MLKRNRTFRFLSTLNVESSFRKTIKTQHTKHTVQKQTYQTYALDENQQREQQIDQIDETHTPLNNQSIARSPVVNTHTRTIAYEKGSEPDRGSEPLGELVSTKTITTGNRTVEILTVSCFLYKIYPLEIRFLKLSRSYIP